MWRGLERVRRRVDTVLAVDSLFDAVLLLPSCTAAGTGRATVERLPAFPGRSEGGRCESECMLVLPVVGGVGGDAAVVLTEQDEEGREENEGVIGGVGRAVDDPLNGSYAFTSSSGFLFCCSSLLSTIGV